MSGHLVIKLALVDSGDDTVFRHIRVYKTNCPTGRTGGYNFQQMKKCAISLTKAVVYSSYKVTFVYTDISGDKAMVTSDSDLPLSNQFNTSGELKIFASVRNDKNELMSPTLESAAESSTQTARKTRETNPFIIKLALVDSGDETIFRHIPTYMDSVGNIDSSDYNFYKLKRSAILLSLGEDPSTPIEVDVDPYKISCFYIDVDGDKSMIASDSELTQAGRQFSENGSIKVFASVNNKKEQLKSPTLESAAESSTHQTAHSTTSTSIMTGATHEMYTYIVKLALVGSGDDVVFRRIKYATNPGRFESMTKRAIWLYLGEEDAQVDLTLYKVSLFYTDSHGDKVSIESDNDIFSAANQFTQGGLKVFANVQRRQDKSEVKNQADLIADAKEGEEKKQADAVAQTHDVVVQNKEEKAVQSEPCEESEAIDETACEEEHVDNSDEQESDDESADFTPPLAARKLYQEYQIFYSKASPVNPQPLPKEFEIDEDESISEEEQAGSSDEEESDDETADSTPPLAARKEYQMFHPKATSPAKTSVPTNVDIVSKGNAEPSFASDAEGSGEIAAVLGETLDRVAQAIDDMNFEFDRTSSAEKIEREIVEEDAKDVNHESWPEELDSNSSEPGEDVKDDCSHDSWNVVSDGSDDADPRD